MFIKQRKTAKNALAAQRVLRAETRTVSPLAVAAKDAKKKWNKVILVKREFLRS